MQKKFAFKIAIIVGLILLLCVPLGMIDSVVSERSGFRYQVELDIANTWTGDQLITGPVLTMPYQVRFEEKVYDKEQRKYRTKISTRWEKTYFVPQQLSVDGEVMTEKRWRGIYSVPVFTGQFSIKGQFAQKDFDDFKAQTRGFADWGKPDLNLAIQDVRGISAGPTLVWNGEATGFESSTDLPKLGEGIHAELPKPEAGDELTFSIDLELRGSRSLQIAPTSNETTVEIQSAWPHPKFIGSFLPVEREISASGFVARWQTSSFSTSIEQHLKNCQNGDCASMSQPSFGVQFIETVDVYQKVRRATKYGILFIVLTFVSFFLTEALVNKPLHPVQYVLVGLALSIFYLLLISLSEHMSFAAAYSVATLSCVLIIGVYLAGVLGKARLGMAYASGIAMLYAMLYAILLSEDLALLMGSLLLFAILAAVMLMTRKVNWYKVSENIETRLPGKRSRDASLPSK